MRRLDWLLTDTVGLAVLLGGLAILLPALALVVS